MHKRQKKSFIATAKLRAYALAVNPAAKSLSPSDYLQALARNQTPFGRAADGTWIFQDPYSQAQEQPTPDYNQMSEDDRYRLIHFAELWDRYHDYRYGPSMSAEEIAELDAFRARNPWWRPTF